MKLASELQRRSTGRTVYVLDEPTTGLHFEDIRKLLRRAAGAGRQGQHRDRHRAQPRRHQERRLGRRPRPRGRLRRRPGDRRGHAGGGRVPGPQPHRALPRAGAGRSRYGHRHETCGHGLGSSARREPGLRHGEGARPEEAGYEDAGRPKKPATKTPATKTPAPKPAPKVSVGGSAAVLLRRCAAVLRRSGGARRCAVRGACGAAGPPVGARAVSSVGPPTLAAVADPTTYRPRPGRDPRLAGRLPVP